MREFTFTEELIFVRPHEGQIEHVAATHYEDGSVYLEGFVERIYEGHQDCWKHALMYLSELGFIESSIAQKQGIIPAGWNPQ